MTVSRIKSAFGLLRPQMLLMSLLAATTLDAARAGDASVAPAELKAIGTIDARFQSYNIEMVEVTGGRFWKPYPRTMRALDERDRYGERPPIDLANARLHKLAAALAPAYLRVSGTWANATFFADTDRAPAKPPPGFNDVLSRNRWRATSSTLPAPSTRRSSPPSRSVRAAAMRMARGRPIRRSA
ncbi:hypothetical protein ACVWXQ_004761 [Bradyrhizobium sp. S3.14.4]